MTQEIIKTVLDNFELSMEQNKNLFFSFVEKHYSICALHFEYWLFKGENLPRFYKKRGNFYIWEEESS